MSADDDRTEAIPIAPPSPRRPGPRPSVVVRRGLRWLADLVRLLGWLIALLLVVYILFTVFHANPANPWAVFVNNWAQALNLGLGNLFTHPDPRLVVAINYGAAAIVWLIIGLLLSRLIRRL